MVLYGHVATYGAPRERLGCYGRPAGHVRYMAMLGANNFNNYGLMVDISVVHGAL